MKSRPRRTSLSYLCLIVLAACSKSVPPPPPPQVAVVRAQMQSVPLERQFVGRLSAYYSANVTARVSGVLLPTTAPAVTCCCPAIPLIGAVTRV